jgi:putative sugar O-methyltransferase
LGVFIGSACGGFGKGGIENFKRTVALDYFDWRYPLHRPHMVFWSHLWDLMKRTTMKEKMLAASPSFYKFVVRLTWQYARRMDINGILYDVTEPIYGNPMPVHFGGHLVSQDLANTSLEMNFMRANSPGPRRVIEVGAGYGRTAHALLSLFPDLEYIIVDVEPALSVAKWYGEDFRNDSRLVFLPLR